MRRLSLYVMCTLWLLAPPAGAREIPRAILERAVRAYRQGAYLQAARELGGIPGLLAIFPVLEQASIQMRARIFLDVGRCYVAAGDTATARQVIRYVFVLDPEIEKGILPLERDRAFEDTRSYLKHLRLLKRQAELNATSPWKAAARSALVPGWGQIYRGRRVKGKFLMGTAAVLTVAWFVADRSYRRAVASYRATTISDLRLFERKGAAQDPRPFDSRFSRAESRAAMANVAIGALAAAWVFGVVDNLIFAPGKVGFVVLLGGLRTPGRGRGAGAIGWRIRDGQR